VFEHNHPPTFEEAFQPHLGAAYNLARWLTLNVRDAEDVLQEACVRALRFSPGFRGVNARAWLMRIVRNTCFTWLHSNNRLQTAAEVEDDLLLADSPNPEEVAMQKDSATRMRKAVESLPPDFREVVVLREIEEMSYKEIAEITGLPAGTVMSRLSRARGRLRQSLIELMNEEAPAQPPLNATAVDQHR
jgi:RNA polymerase sigma-70 factor (ECF subfamily)